MNETADQEFNEQYASIPPLEWGNFNRGSFLKWDLEKHDQHEVLFRGTNSYLDALDVISRNYPGVMIVRGTSLENQSITEANFSVGEIETALLYTKRNVFLQPQRYPIILYSPLANVLTTMHKGIIVPTPTEPWDDYKMMLLYHGRLNLRFSELSGYNIFTIRKPPINKNIPNNLVTTI